MSEKITIDAIMQGLSSGDGKRRLLYDRAKIGGTPAWRYYLLFAAIFIVDFLLIFKTSFLAKFGIATSVVAFIILLNISIVAIYLLARKNNAAFVDTAAKAWQAQIGTVDLKTLLSNQSILYKDFFSRYAALLKENKHGEALAQGLCEAIADAEREHSDLVEAMRRKEK